MYDKREDCGSSAENIEPPAVPNPAVACHVLATLNLSSRDVVTLNLDGSTFVGDHTTCMACGNCDCPGDTPAPANDGKVCSGQCCTDKKTGAPVLPGERRDKLCVTTYPKVGTFLKVTIETD